MTKVKEITPKELKAKFDQNDDFYLLDVRNPDEPEICTIGGELIPLGELAENLDKIPTDNMIVVYCRSGGRSGKAVQIIQSELNLEEVYNLAGGILRYSDDVDSSLVKY